MPMFVCLSACTKGSCYPLNRYGSPLQLYMGHGLDYNYLLGGYLHLLKRNLFLRKLPAPQPLQKND